MFLFCFSLSFLAVCILCTFLLCISIQKKKKNCTLLFVAIVVLVSLRPFFLNLLVALYTSCIPSFFSLIQSSFSYIKNVHISSVLKKRAAIN